MQNGVHNLIQIFSRLELYLMHFHTGRKDSIQVSKYPVAVDHREFGKEKNQNALLLTNLTNPRTAWQFSLMLKRNTEKNKFHLYVPGSAVFAVCCASTYL